MAIVLVVVLVLLVMLGLPIIGSLGLAGLATLLAQGLPPYLLAQTVYGGLASFTLLAIPLFILTGEILYRCGAAARLVRFVTMLVGWLPGGLAMTVVVSTMIFSGLSGSVNADAAPIGAVMLPPMIEAKYKREWAAAIVAAAAGTGILIPPSITMIVLATIANLSVQRLFLAALLPAVIIAIAKMTVIFVRAKFFDRTADKIQFSKRELLRSFIGALPALMAPVIILGGILTGIFTASEAASVAVIYATILALAYRSLRWKDAADILFTAGKLSGVVIVLVGVASTAAYLFAYDQASDALQSWAAGLVHQRLLFTAAVTVIFWVMGAILDGLPALIILMPLFVPLAQQAGMNPIHFAVLALAVIGISLVTPPLGTACFVVSGIARTKMDRLLVPMVPFILILFGAILLLAYVPGFSLWLPGVVLGST